MSDVIRLVQNDTLPTLFVTLTDQTTGLPIDLSTATGVIMRYFAVGASVLTDTLTGTILAGGTGGAVSFPLSASTLATPGQFRGEVVVTYPGPLVQTVYETLRFNVRPVN